MMNSDYLKGWDVKAEQRKADFMEHMYQCSGRANSGPGVVGLYTGLWQEFCLKEAGPFARDTYFERLEAVKQYQQMLVAAETVSDFEKETEETTLSV